MTPDERKMMAYDELFVYVAEEGSEGKFLSLDRRITIFHEFFRIFSQEFITELDFREFVNEEVKQLDFK